MISAHNEEQCIAERVKNALASDYPREKLEIVIASDGSDDRTHEIVRQFADEGVRLVAYDGRRGKAAVLNASVGATRGQIIVFSDANTNFEPDAIRRLVRWFADVEVGVVCGRLVLTDAATGKNADGVYWRYETFLKQCEGRLGGLLGANGAIYAMRRELYCPVPDNTIVDDFVIPLLAKLHHGFRIVYDQTARAYEETAATISHEFRRRVRIGTGDYQSLTLLWRLLRPRHGWTAVTFLCHKLLRWLSPFLLVLMAVSNVFLVASPFYAATMAGQIVFYSLAIVGTQAVGNHILLKLLRGISLFCSVNAALLVGFCKWMFLKPSGAWQRTNR